MRVTMRPASEAESQPTGGRPAGLLIDAHNHVGSPDLVDHKAQSAVEIVQALDSAGVDKAVIFPFNSPHPRDGFRFANDHIAQAVSSFPARLIGFGRVDPTRLDLAVQEIERMASNLHLRGVKLHPRAQGFGPKHPGLHAVLKKVSEHALVVVFDSGSTNAPWHEMSDLARQFPEMPMIMAHMRGAGYIDAAEAAPNIYLGTTKVPEERIVEAVQEIGPERIVSGSDSPYVSVDDEINKIRSIDRLSRNDKNLILGLNMARILEAG